VLAAERLRARQLTRKFNDSAVEDKDGRKAILKELLNPNSGNVFIEPPFRCDYGSYTTFGEGSEVNFGLVILDVCEGMKSSEKFWVIPEFWQLVLGLFNGFSKLFKTVVIGKRCLIAPNVHFYAATHPVCPIERRDFELGAPIKVGDDVWIGGQVVICPGVTIGDGVTIGEHFWTFYPIF